MSNEFCGECGAMKCANENCNRAVAVGKNRDVANKIAKELQYSNASRVTEAINTDTYQGGFYCCSDCINI